MEFGSVNETRLPAMRTIAKRRAKREP